MAENGRWQLAFWLITVICGAWLMGLTNNVVANDRINTQKHEEIMTCLYGRLTSMETRLVRIETKLEK